jgi:hypothetical protein
MDGCHQLRREERERRGFHLHLRPVAAMAGLRGSPESFGSI